MTFKTEKEIPRALLVSIKTPEDTEEQILDSVEELERLVTTLGFRVIGKEFQRLPTTTGPAAVGTGKLEELAKLTSGNSTADGTTVELADVVIFDCDLRPSQLRVIEAAVNVEVLDRTGVIIEIFSRHAKTRAARLQVEIARLNYLSPRLREVGPSGERQQGRGGGESQLETGRRNVRDKLAELKKELASLEEELSQSRSSRAELPCVALVGYTNAGKSSTMRALTGSEVLVEDKLFATLDTTVRALKPETQPRVLVSDTVGFIKKLPHDLVASFRSTLDEANNASLLLYVVDAADASFRSQLEVVDEALKGVGAGKTPNFLVLNKIDKVPEGQRKRLKLEYPDAIQTSALEPESVAQLRERIVKFFEDRMQQEEIFVPYKLEKLVGEIRTSMLVIDEKFEEEGTRFTVKAGATQLARIRKRYQLPDKV
ncbi:MAG: GTPase HflX [Bdellovibrionota bacterium]